MFELFACSQPVPADDTAGNTNDSRVGGNGMNDNRSCANLAMFTDRNVAQHLGSRANDNVIPDGGVALALSLASAAECHALVEQHIIGDLGCLSNHDAHAVIDEKAASNPRPRVDLDAGERPANLRDDAWDQRHAGLVKTMGEPMKQDRVKARVAEYDFEDAFGGRIFPKNRLDLLADGAEHETFASTIYYRIRGRPDRHVMVSCAKVKPTCRNGFVLLFPFLCVSSLWAVPKLRLSNTVLGPVSVAPGTSPQPQELDAFGMGERLNTETGDLRLSLSSTASWVSAGAGAIRNCTNREGQCIPVRFTFATQSLEAGAYSATVTVRDPNAIDAPQNVLVLINVGSNAPDRVNLFVAPNGSSDRFEFTTNARLTASASTQTGGDWLTLTLNSTGSFAFVQPYRIAVRHLNGMAEGTYGGSVRLQSMFPPDNKTVNVTLLVTSQPIAASTRNDLRMRLAQNSTKVTKTVRILNRGMGSHTISVVTASTQTGGNWLSVQKAETSSELTITLDSANMNPGVYKGAVAVQSNAVNSALTIPVVLEVVRQEAPTIHPRGVLESAVFEEEDLLAAGGIVTAFGEQLSYQEASVADGFPISAQLGETRVFVNNQPAPVFSASYDQVTFQVPYDVARGQGVVRIDRGDQRGNDVSAVFVPALPKIIRLRLREQGLSIPENRDFFGVILNPDGTLSLPRGIGVLNSRPTRRGEQVSIYLFGMGATKPPVRAGEAGGVLPFPVVDSAIARVYFGALALNTGVVQDPLFAGLAPGMAGIYVVHVVVPENAPLGDVPVRIQMDTVSSEYALIHVE